MICSNKRACYILFRARVILEGEPISSFHGNIFFSETFLREAESHHPTYQGKGSFRSFLSPYELYVTLCSFCFTVVLGCSILEEKPGKHKNVTIHVHNCFRVKCL